MYTYTKSYNSKYPVTLSLTVKQPSSGICSHFYIQNSNNGRVGHTEWDVWAIIQLSNHSSHITGRMIRSSRFSPCFSEEQPRNEAACYKLIAANLLHSLISISGHQKLPACLVDLIGLGMFYDHAEATYLVQIDHCCSSSSQQPHKFCLKVTKAWGHTQLALFICCSAWWRESECTQNVSQRIFACILCLPIIPVKLLRTALQWALFCG